MAVERPHPADENVGVKRMSRREALRKPSLLTGLKPGEKVTLAGREGDLVVERPKLERLTPEELERCVQELTKDWPVTDALELLDRR